MVDVARQLLDELMGRNRNLDPSASAKEVSWSDEEFCPYFLVKFCPHDLFVNTRADLGQCTKLHDDEAKRLFDEAKPCRKKTQYEEDFLRFCTNMINEVDRKIVKGKQRLLLMNSKTEGGRPATKHQDQLNFLTEKINKLVREAEEAGTRGDVEQAQVVSRVNSLMIQLYSNLDGLMEQCDQLKEEKEALLKQQESNGWSVTAEIAASQEKQMEVCEVCGAFLIVGDAQQRIDDHLTGKQHLGYSKLRKAVDEMYEARRKNTLNLEDRLKETIATVTNEKTEIEIVIDVIIEIIRIVLIVMIIANEIVIVDAIETNEIVIAVAVCYFDDRVIDNGRFLNFHLAKIFVSDLLSKDSTAAPRDIRVGVSNLPTYHSQR
uniref:Uncharacterized protein n=1 Tax=Anopheles culicifacies TaxID=139723 RepID=A0A182M1P7_9DIPT